MQSRASSSSGRSMYKWFSEIGYSISGWQSFIHALRAYYLSQNKLRALVDDKDLPEQSLDNYYVNLALVTNDAYAKAEAGLQENSMTREEKYQAMLLSGKMHGVNELFPLLDGASTGWISVTGRAGTGKTTLEQYIAYCWGTREACWYNRFDFVFRVKLNLLRQLQFTPGQSESSYLAQLIYASIEIPDTALSLESIRLCLERYPNQLLLLLDGFDEIQTLYKQNHAIKRLIDYAMHFPNGMITTRPDAMPLEWQQETPPRFIRQFENVGLTEDNVQQYVSKYFQATATKAARPELSETLLAALSTNPEMMNLAQIPVNVAVFCLTWEEEQKRRPTVSSATPAPTIFTMTQLYHRLIVWLARRYCVKFQENCPFDPQAAREEQLLNYCQTELTILSTLAYRAFIENKIQTIDHALLEECIPDQALLYKISKEFGALRALGHPERIGEYAPHYFIHLTYQEYFTAVYIAQKLSAPESKDRTQEIQRRQTIQTLALQIAEERNNPKYAVVWTFLAGLVSTLEYSLGVDYFWDAFIELNGSYPSELSIIALHPHVSVLKNYQRILHEALCTHKAINNNDSMSNASLQYPRRLNVLQTYEKNLFQWTVASQTEDFISTWDSPCSAWGFGEYEENRYDKDGYQRRSKYHKQQQQHKIDLQYFGIDKPNSFSLLSIFKYMPGFSTIFASLCEKLKNTDEYICKSAIEDFDRIQSLDKDTLERIKKSMEHGNLHVKIYVIRAILRLEPDDAAVNLAFQVILKEKDWYTMGKAAEILNRLPKLSVETLQVLREVLLGKNGGWSSQLQLAEALLRFQPSNLEAMQLIQGHLRDKYYNSDASWYCRLKAASALLHIQVFDAKAIQILQHDLRSRSKIDERMRIAEVLLQLQPFDINALQFTQETLKISSDSLAEIRAAEAFQWLPILDNVSLDTLLHALKVADDSTRWRSARALLWFQPADVKSVQTLRVALKDKCWKVRNYAAGTLLRIFPFDFEALESLQNALISLDNEKHSSSAAWLLSREARSLQNISILKFLLSKADDMTETDFKTVYWVYLALARVSPLVYASLPEILNNPTAQRAFVMSIWLHVSSIVIDAATRQMIIDGQGFELSGTPQVLQNFIRQLQTYQEQFIAATVSSSPEFPEILHILTQPIILPRVTNVFEPSFLTDDLPAAPEDRFQTMIHMLEKFSQRLISIEGISQEQQGEQGRLGHEVKSALDHIRSLQQQAATTVTEADFDSVAEQIIQLEARVQSVEANADVTNNRVTELARRGAEQAAVLVIHDEDIARHTDIIETLEDTQKELTVTGLTQFGIMASQVRNVALSNVLQTSSQSKNIL